MDMFFFREILCKKITVYQYLKILKQPLSFRVSHRWGGGGGRGYSKFNVGGGGGLSQYMGKHGGLEMLLKNTCEGVHLLVKLLAISRQACKFN